MTPIDKPIRFTGIGPLEPFIGGLATNSERSAKLTDVLARLAAADELKSLRHDGKVSPRHILLLNYGQEKDNGLQIR